MGDIKSKLRGSDYQHCPLCGVTTSIGHVVDSAQARVDSCYQTISDRNDRIHALQGEVNVLTATVATLRARVPHAHGGVLPTRADILMLVDDLVERTASYARLLGGDDHSISGTPTKEAEREAADARTALLAALAMLTERES